MLKIPKQQVKPSVDHTVEYRILKEFLQPVMEGFYFNRFIIVLKIAVLILGLRKSSVVCNHTCFIQ